jgi:hypothetical protein
MDLAQLKRVAAKKAQQQRQKEEHERQRMKEQLKTIDTNRYTPSVKRILTDREKQDIIDSTINHGTPLINASTDAHESMLRRSLRDKYNVVRDSLAPLDAKRKTGLSLSEGKQWDSLDMTERFISLEMGQYQSGYTIRTVPYYLKNGELYFVLTKVKKYNDWTVFGGKCNEPGKKHTRHMCAAIELYQESRLLFTPEKYAHFAGAINYNLLTYNYYNPKQKHGYQYEFLQFLPITEEFAHQLIGDYYKSATKDNLPTARLGTDGLYYSDTGETEEIKLVTIDQLMEHIFCSLEYSLNITPTQRCKGVTKINLNWCFDTSITKGFLTQMIKYIEQLVNAEADAPSLLAEKKSLAMTSKMESRFREYFSHIFNPDVDWQVFSDFYVNPKHSRFIDDLFAIIFTILRTDLHTHHPTNPHMITGHHTSRFINL